MGWRVCLGWGGVGEGPEAAALAWASGDAVRAAAASMHQGLVWGLLLWSDLGDPSRCGLRDSPREPSSGRQMGTWAKSLILHLETHLEILLGSYQ